jgi:hypothetical protein
MRALVILHLELVGAWADPPPKPYCSVRQTGFRETLKQTVLYLEKTHRDAGEEAVFSIRKGFNGLGMIQRAMIR